jgi:hypothetical protein
MGCLTDPCSFKAKYTEDKMSFLVAEFSKPTDPTNEYTDILYGKICDGQQMPEKRADQGGKRTFTYVPRKVVDQEQAFVLNAEIVKLKESDSKLIEEVSGLKTQVRVIRNKQREGYKFTPDTGKNLVPKGAFTRKEQFDGEQEKDAAIARDRAIKAAESFKKAAEAKAANL